VVFVIIKVMFSQPEKNIEQFHVDPGMSVADLGSGAGFYSLALAKMVGTTGKVFAVDVQKDLLTKLQSEAHGQGINNIKIVWGDLDVAKGSTLPDQSVDRVVIANVLFQVEEKDNLIAEAHRILKPKGKLLFVDWSDSYGGLGPHPNDIIREDQAKSLFEAGGFSFEKDITTGDHHYGFVVQKV
jgi:ubiquinone/menaquinone biosynthesis C-methylase UbiE